VAASLAEVDEPWLRARYLALDPDDYGREPSEDDLGYTWAYLAELKGFFDRAAAAGRPVVFTVDL
jgi:hypothetical protein